MKPELSAAIHLLHTAASGALATHSLQLPGYPFASALPFALDERHRPVFLISALAEHTKNLAADPRASLLVTSPEEPELLSAARMTVLGEAARIDASPELVARYLRYQPDAEQVLDLGDFAFFALAPQRIRHIGGFARMGWLEQEEWADAAILPLEDEASCLRELLEVQRPGLRLLGIDGYGCDIEHRGKRDRLRLKETGSTPEKLCESIRRLLNAL